jgi:hypothetical protein
MAEIIPEKLDLAFLQDPLHVKIGLVEFYILPLVATSQKTTSFFSLLGTNIIEIHFFNGKLKNASYKSCWPWKDAHLCQKWGQNLKVFFKTCTNHDQLGRKPSEVPLGAIFCKQFFYEILIYMSYLIFFLGTTSHIMTPYAGFFLGNIVSPFFLQRIVGGLFWRR